jgi:hypothetical protein
MRQGPRLVKWRLVFTRQAQKDAEKSGGRGLPWPREKGKG